MTKHITIAVTVGLLFATSSAAADSVDVDPGNIARIADKLRLTSQQRQQIRDLHDAVRKTSIRLRAEIEAIGIDLRRELDRDSPSEAKVGGYISKISQLEGKSRRARVVSWIRTRKLLTAEQRKLLSLFNAGKNQWSKSKRAMRKQLKKEFARLESVRKRLSVELRRAKLGARTSARRRALDKLRMKLQPNPDADSLVDPFSGPKYGRITIIAKPYAKIYVDGKFVGTTPLTMKLRPGKHHIKSVSRLGVKRTTITVRAGETTKLAIGR